MSPGEIRYPDTKSIEYRLEMVNGPTAETVDVGLRKPLYQSGADGPIGSPITVGQPRLEGAGSLGAIGNMQASYTPGVCLRGYEADGIQSVEVRLPANSTSVLVVPARTGRYPPWPDTSYRLGFGIGRNVFRPARPRVTGKSGVRITLDTRPRALPLTRNRLPRLVRGQRLLVKGKTEPAVRRGRIRLRFRSSDDRSLSGQRTRTVANVRTDRRGRFTYSWTAGAPAFYTLDASFRSPTRLLTRDTACPVGFSVRG